jgi:HEAT repeat protein
MQKLNVTELIEQCSSDDSERQAYALQELVDMRSVTAIPAILQLLQSPDSTIRFSAAEALGDLGDSDIKTVGPALMEVLTDSDGIVRSGAVDALGTLDYKAAGEPIAALLLNDADALVRASAAEALGDLENSDAIEPLLQALQDPDIAVRLYAASSLGILGTPDLLPQLEAVIESEHSLAVRAELLITRYRLGAREEMTQLLNLLFAANEELAINLLNGINELIIRQPPPELSDDAQRLCEALADVANRFPMLLARQAQALIAKLLP